MLDKDVRKFQRAAHQRLSAGGILFERGFNLESTYLAGYAVECALKALILARTPAGKRAVLFKERFRGKAGHDLESLKLLLARTKSEIPNEVAGMLSRVNSWSTDLRYEVGLMGSKDAKSFLDAAKYIREWVDRNLE